MHRHLAAVLWLAAARLTAAHIHGETGSADHWLNVTIIDTILPGNDNINGCTNATYMTVYASKFNYTSHLQAVKVMIRGNIGKPSPSAANPLVVSVRSKGGGHTFTIPYNVYDRLGEVLFTQDHARRYLCPAEAGETEYAMVSVGTGYLNPKKNDSLQFLLRFESVNQFRLGLDEPGQLQVSPTDPAAYAFVWPASAPETVLLSVSSVEAATVCTTIALQPRVCPMAQTPEELAADASFFTITTSGALSVRRSQFPDGFFLLVMPRLSDVLCDPSAPQATNATRQKTVRVILTAQHSPLGLLALPAVLALLLLLLGAAGTFLLRRDLESQRTATSQDTEQRASPSDVEQLVEDWEPENVVVQTLPAPKFERSAVSLLVGAVLLLLALGGDAVLAALGVRTTSGDLDVCYRNDLCNHASQSVQGVNHLVAHLPYIGAGYGALFAVRAQKGVYKQVTVDDVIEVGAPHDWGLLEAVAVAMVLQGVLGGLQSACPGPLVAPLDTALVYFALTALACKLFQTRRGRRSSPGHYAPLLFTAALVLAGLAKQRAGNTWYAWVVLAMLHVLATVVIAIQLYVLGEASAALGDVKRVWNQWHRLEESPYYRINRATVVLVLAANISLAIAGAAAKIPDFSHYVMIFFVLHVAIHLAYYLLLKLVRSGESVSRSSAALLAAGVLLLLAAVITLCGFSTFSTEEPPAVSRLRSRQCLPGGLFDTHDLWHMLAAPALLCLTLGVLLLDDDLLHTPRMEIARF